MRIEIKILNRKFYQEPSNNPDWVTTSNLPSYATTGSGALDLVCTEDVTIYPGETKMIPTGLAIWIGSRINEFQSMSDIGVTGLILPRSGLGTKGLILANTVGVIDEDYQGELLVQVWNRNSSIDLYQIEDFIQQTPLKLTAGDRFAQLMFTYTARIQWDVVKEFSNKTQRNNGGFGSTGE